MSNFWQRTLTGAIFVGVIAVAVLAGPYTFLALLMLINLLGMVEFAGLFRNTEYKPALAPVLFSGGVIFLLAAAYLTGYISAYYLPIVLPLMMLTYVYELYNHKSRIFQRASIGAAGMVYISFSLSSFAAFAFSSGAYEPHAALAFFLLIWSSDTFAYLSGRAFGRHKLFPSVSPKKTWEGSIGGTIGTMGIAALLHYFWGLYTLPVWLGLAFVIVLFGTWGDLVESLLKRSLVVKDSGNLLPGHGGVLDRFDSLLFSAPFVWVFIHFLS